MTDLSRSLVPITPLHAPVLAQLHPEAFEEPWGEKTFQGLLSAPAVWGWCVVAAQNEPLGFILCQGDAREAEILTIMTRPAYHRQGIARMLLAAMQEKTQKIFIEVADDNQSARRFYESLDFAYIGLRKNYYRKSNNTRIDAHVLCLQCK